MLRARLLHRSLGRSRTPLLSGQALIIFLMFLSFVLFLFVGIGLDVAGAYRVKESHRQNVKLAQDSFTAYGNTLKFSNDPRSVAKEAVLQTLKDNKYTGTAELWLYELGTDYTSSTGTPLPSSHRMMGATLVLSGEYQTMFMQLAGSGLGKIPVKTNSTWTVDLYSKSAHVWRPTVSSSTSGYGIHVTWKVVDGVASVTANSELHDIKSVPSTLSAALSNRVDSIDDTTTSGG